MRKILVIEDDPAINRLLSLSFKDDLDTQVDFAQDYLRGLSMALEKPYDLFLVDLNLDSHSGLDLKERSLSKGH